MSLPFNIAIAKRLQRNHVKSSLLLSSISFVAVFCISSNVSNSFFLYLKS
jgi:hypothetical protein